MNHITSDLREKWMRQDQGIFSEDYKLDSEREEESKMSPEDKEKEKKNNMKILKKMHSLYFPISWKEAIVN